MRGEILLNGEPFYMRGALDQAFWPDTLYTAPTDAEIEREILLAKEMGLNLLRKHIEPGDPRYLDAADRLGTLIWAEPDPLIFGSASTSRCAVTSWRWSIVTSTTRASSSGASTTRTGAFRASGAARSSRAG